MYRFVVGPYEEYSNAENREDSASLVAPRVLQSSRDKRQSQGRKPRSSMTVIPTACCRVYLRLLRTIQGLSRHTACSHPFSCTYYTLEVNCSVIMVHLFTMSSVSLGYKGLHAQYRSPSTKLVISPSRGTSHSQMRLS